MLPLETAHRHPHTQPLVVVERIVAVASERAVAGAVDDVFDVVERKEHGAGHAGGGDGVRELDVEGRTGGGDVVDEDVGIRGDEGRNDNGAGVEHRVGSWVV